MFLTDILHDAFNFIFPRRCVVCENELDDDNENFVCLACLGTLPVTGFHKILNNPFEERFAGKFPFDRGTAVYFYERSAPISQIVHGFKYHNLPGLATEMGREIVRELHDSDFFDDIDLIIPVGSHFLRLLERGYNQTCMLAKGISEETGIPVADCLRMRRYHVSQTKKTAEQRIHSTKRLFKVLPRRLEPFYSLQAPNRTLHVLLIDDICTTGSTLLAAADALLDYDPSLQLRLLTLACTF